MVLADGSLRLYNFVTSLSPKIAGFVDLPASEEFPDVNSMITLGCYDDKQYAYQRRQRVAEVRGPLPRDVPDDVSSKLRRVLMPRKWTKEMKARFHAVQEDKNVKFIVFPILSIRESLCPDPEDGDEGAEKDPKDPEDDKKKHLVLLVYNKTLENFEMWDDMYGHTNNHYGLYRLHRQYAEVYLFPVLRSLGLKIASDEVHLPVYSEKWYLRIKRGLTAAHYDNNYPAIYAGFLTDYIARRLKKLKGTCKDLCNEIDVEQVVKAYGRLLTFNRQWQLQLQKRCKKPSQLMNPMTGKCIRTTEPASREILGIDDDDACPYPALRNIKTDRCNKGLQIHEHYVDVGDDSSFLTHDVKRDQWGPLMKYMSKKYPYMATAPANKFKWNMNKQTLEWELQKPADFEKVMKAGMSNSKVKFIVFFILLTDHASRWGHSNALIIDKRARTLERFESNTPEEWSDFNNGVELDKEIEEAFAPYNLTYISMGDTCPIGFQELEEDSKGFKSMGGNCELWTLWYVDLRLANPDVPRLELIKGAWKVLAKEGAFKQFIHGYHDFLRKELKKK